MREVISRLHEATTALDRELTKLYLAEQRLPQPSRRQTIEQYWKAKQSLWYATMHVLYADSPTIAGAEGT